MVSTVTVHNSRGHWRCVSVIDDIALYGRTEVLKCEAAHKPPGRVTGCITQDWVGVGTADGGQRRAYPEEGRPFMLEGARVKLLKNTTKENNT